MSALRHADSIIEDHPDSAYAMLQRINATTLTGNKEQAYYSLLIYVTVSFLNPFGGNVTIVKEFFL